MLIGYMRVFTGEQSFDLQRDVLERAGCQRPFEDVCSGTIAERSGMNRAMKHARSGGVLVFWNFYCTGHSLQHTVQLVAYFCEHGVGLTVLTSDTDTNSSAGRFVFCIFAMLIASERDPIREITMAGRARGLHDSYPSVKTNSKLKVAVALMADQDSAARDVVKQLGVSLSASCIYVGSKGQPKAQANLLLGNVNHPLSAPATPPANVRHSIEGR